MKKHISILLGLLAVFSSLFISCDENEIDSNICKITVNSEGNGTVSITDYIGTSVNVLIGNRMEVVATPDDGYAFIGWYITGTETPVSINAVFAFTTSESVALTARFAKLSDIIISSGGNGSVAFKDATGNSIPVLPGAEVTVIATPDTDCDFVGWFVGDSETPISTEKVYTFTVTESIILTGQFSKWPIVTVRSAGNGSVSIKDTDGTYKVFLPGTETTVIATPYKDCDFIGWFVADEGSPISTDTEYTFTVTEDINLTAKFSRRPVVTIRCSDNGNVAFKDYSGTSIAFLLDTEVTVIATPNENCDFVGWFIADEESPKCTDMEYTFNVTEDIALTAKFSKRPTVAIHSAGYGSVSFKDYSNNTVVVLPNTEVTVIATPDENCDFIGWFVDDKGSALSTDTEYTFRVEENITLTARFNKWPTVTIKSAGNGTVAFRDSNEISKVFIPGTEVTVIAIPNENHELIGWFIADEESPKCTDMEYTFNVTEDIALTAKFERIKTYNNGYEYVDLGLSVKWATCNVGASSPSRSGTYYAWGETTSKNNYTKSSYTYHNIDIGSNISGTKYDVAHTKWGGSWRIPTEAEWKELVNECTWTWTTYNGVKGYNVTSSNGNSIFLPVTGMCDNTFVQFGTTNGYYWSATIGRSNSNCAYNLFFKSDFYYTTDLYRYCGRAVRPVCE